MASRGKGARIKGATFETKLAKMLTEATGKTWKRGLGQSRTGGSEISDVYSDEVKSIHIEAKRQKNCSIKAALDQAVEDVQESGKIPVVVTQDDRRPVLVTMLWDDWIKLFNAALASDIL